MAGRPIAIPPLSVETTGTGERFVPGTMRTVLIIDDELGIVEALSALLSDDGYRVFSALNGRQGIERLSEARPDLILVDFMMPVMDGPGVIQALHSPEADPTYAHIPVILMSAVPEAVVRRATNGFTAFLRKPFDAHNLTELITRVLRTEEREEAPR
jgi:CheY-like chemotaxis protein